VTLKGLLQFWQLNSGKSRGYRRGIEAGQGPNLTFRAGSVVRLKEARVSAVLVPSAREA